MKPLINAKQNLSPSDKTKIILVVFFLGILLFTFGILLGLLIRQARQQQAPQAISTIPLTSIVPPTSVAPTMLIPTPDCGSPTLVIGSTTFHIQTVNPAQDGSLTVPSDTSGIAYWVDGTNTNSVFVLSPTPENLSVMSTVTVGSMATATRSDCNSATYSLSAPQQGNLNASASPDQSVDGITIFFQTDPSGAGFVFKGELTEEQITTFNTPVVGVSDIQAEIGLLETTASPDGTTITLNISIHNYGEAAFTLSTNDLSITQQDGTALVMVSSEPSLPKEIAPTVTETFYLTFPRPSSQIATLKIFTVEYDIEGY